MTINMDDINNNPITGEEIAALIIGGQGVNKQLAANLAEQFKSYLTDKAKQDGVAQAELINIQTKAFQEIKEEIAELKMLLQENSRSTVTMSYSIANAAQWRKETQSVIEALCPKLKLPRGQVYGNVYDLILKKYGTDVRALYEENKNNMESIISMCAYNDSLRAKFDSSLKDIYDSVKCGSIEVMKMPASIRRDCLTIAPNKPVSVTFKRILKKMAEISCMDIDAYIEKNAHQVGYARFVKSFFVSKSKTLNPIYNQAVEELKKEQAASNSEV